MTDQDWGRLYYYQGTGDPGLIMPPRSIYLRDFITNAWTDIAIGMAYCGCGLDDPVAPLVYERMDEALITNLFHFGLTNGVNNNIDVGNNPYFLGIRGIQDSVAQLTTSPKRIFALANTLVNDETTTINGDALELPLSDGVSDLPFNMIGLRFNYNPVNHTVRINISTQLNINLPTFNENISIMKEFLAGIPTGLGTASAVFTINNVAKYKTFYIYWPYVFNRLKLHCLGVRKFG